MTSHCGNDKWFRSVAAQRGDERSHHWGDVGNATTTHSNSNACTGAYFRRNSSAIKRGSNRVTNIIDTGTREALAQQHQVGKWHRLQKTVSVSIGMQAHIKTSGGTVASRQRQAIGEINESYLPYEHNYVVLQKQHTRINILIHK
jgi:hypothetical protein